MRETDLKNTLDKVAYSLCEMELRARMPRTLEELISELQITWKRHLPEALLFIQALEKTGLQISPMEDTLNILEALKDAHAYTHDDKLRARIGAIIVKAEGE